MTARFFLDTSFLIDLIDGQEDALILHDELAGEETTGTICVYELEKFATLGSDEFFGGKDLVQFSPGDAREAGAVYREQESAGEPIGEIDAQIAGIARNRGLTLVTRDDDFRSIDDLDCRYY